MRQTINKTTIEYKMDQSDIEYIIEILNDSVSEKDWDKVDEAIDTLKEFLDTRNNCDDE